MADPPKRLSNLVSRLLTAVVAVPVILALLYVAPKWAFAILVYAATLVAAAELMGMTAPGHRLHQAWGVLATGGVLSVLLFQPTPAALVTTIIALATGGLLVGLLRHEPVESAPTRVGWMIAGPIYIGGFMFAMGALHQREYGGSWVVLAMMLAWFADTGGYFAGRLFGKHRLSPISPKKTVEGSVGGLLGSLVGALLAHFVYLPVLPLLDAVLLALVAGALGQAGDLAESLIKRGTGVKDSGRILPGHGGILDRIDALMFTAATTWVYTQWFHG